MGQGIKGDFTGFSFNGVHSSELGLTVISNSNRYNDKLTPTFKDNTAAIPGGDGTFYWGSNYDKREWSINVAFDSVTELQLREMRQIFNGKTLGPLVFDEAPYKTYFAKLKAPVELKYLCFEKEEEEELTSTSEILHNHNLGNSTVAPVNREKVSRVYKGEGTIQFVAYQPYAECAKKYLSDYSEWDNVDEWADASGLLNIELSPAIEGTTVTISLYNPGDLPTDWTWTFISSSCPSTLISFSNNGEISQIGIEEFDLVNGDTGVVLSSATKLLAGINDDGILTGNFYNHYLSVDDFIKIPITISTNDLPTVTISGPDTDYETFNYNYRYY